MPTKEEVLQALSAIRDPDLGRDIVSLGFVKEVAIEDGHVRVRIELTTPACPVRDAFRREAEQRIGALAGVRSVEVEMTARTQGPPPMAALPKVANILAVGSGKGGVGKSTIAVNLAVQLARMGARAGLLDADIYGPSAPLMLGLAGRRPEARPDEKTMIPLEAHGVKVNSLGFLMPPDQAAIWRGPMAASAIMQLLLQTDWGELDYLVLDFPPGTGDVQLSVMQQVKLSGFVVVTTAQEAAIADARRAAAMAKRLNVPVLGVVENMRAFVCPHCGEETPIFGEGGADRLAGELGAPLLARVPLSPKAVAAGDAGTPITASDPGDPAAVAMAAMAEAVVRRVAQLAMRTIPIQSSESAS